MKDLHEIHLDEIRSIQQSYDERKYLLDVEYIQQVHKSREKLMQATLRRFGLMCGEEEVVDLEALRKKIEEDQTEIGVNGEAPQIEQEHESESK